MYVPIYSQTNRQDTAISALYLSTKLCETPVRLKELLNVYLVIIHRNRHLRHSPVLAGTNTLSITSTSAAAPGPGPGAESISNNYHINTANTAQQPPPPSPTHQTALSLSEFTAAYHPPPGHASIWWTMKDAVCTGEMQILKRLGFNMQVSKLWVAGVVCVCVRVCRVILMSMEREDHHCTRHGSDLV
jgi:hypothetical protein